MSQTNPSFQVADLSNRFKAACIQFDTLLSSEISEALAAIRHKFRDGLREYKQQGALTVAFIGQYSAGKSTIISALTGRRDIHIDADIATDTTTPYDWNDIRIIDTPGLFTDRADHDDITYEAISKADLLVFCLTHMLFDTLTVENFKKLAYGKSYRWKIMLVVNKMSAAAGEESQKIASYRHSLGEALQPYKLEEFPTCFIDAKDYCDGIDEEDDFLIEVSRFDTFITELNRFVQYRASLTRLDTPVRIVLSCLDDAQIAFARNTDEDTAFLEVLARLSRRVNQERERLRTKIKSIVLEMSAAIAQEGICLASVVGESRMEDLTKQSEFNICKHYEKAGENLENTCAIAFESICSTVAEELQSKLTQSFIAQLTFNGKVTSQSPGDNINTQQLQAQVQWLQEMGGQVGAKITQAATKESVTGLFRSTNVAGSTLHQGVYSVGKLIGFKFKPWQAVGIAKNIGNVAQFLGPALAVVSLGIDLHTAHQEREYERKMADARRDVTSQFKKIAVDLEQQIEQHLQEFESQTYSKLERNIAEVRQKNIEAMTASSKEIGQISAIRKELESIILEVQNSAPSNSL